MSTFMNQESTPLTPVSFFTKVKLAIAAGFILAFGFMTSLFFLTLAAFMMPFVAVKAWLLQKEMNKHFAMQQEQANEQEAAEPVNEEEDKTS